MSPHEALMSELIRVKKLLEEYMVDHTPTRGNQALGLLQSCIIQVTKFLEDDDAGQ